MKIITIPDVHGRPNWKAQINDPYDYDLIIFLGDYVDGYGIDGEDILNNLKDIIELKKAFPDKVILLLGNHDIQYIWEHELYECSGFNGEYCRKYNTLFNENLNLFKVCHQIENYLWSHAGIQESYYKEVIRIWPEVSEQGDIASQMNFMLTTKAYRTTLFRVGYTRGGSYMHGGIVWADAKETSHDILIGYNQIVGHTPQQGSAHKIYFPDYTFDDISTSICYTDTHSREAYIVKI